MAALISQLPAPWLTALAALPGQSVALLTTLLDSIDVQLQREAEAAKEVYPAREEIFKALELTSPLQTKVVILGQDPYHAGQAHGLSFSVPEQCPLPPSLRNIFRELESDCGVTRTAAEGDLTGWGAQGVLLLNSVLTVAAGEPASHAQLGWQAFTDLVIRVLALSGRPLVYLLWGGYAGSKVTLLCDQSQFIIQIAPPSPLAAYRGFFGSKPFSRCNAYLQQKQLLSIDWAQ